MTQNNSSITAGQMRAGRALARLSANDLAVRAAVGLSTVQRAEASEGVPNMTRANMDAIRRALEAAGVRFTEGGGVEPATDQ